MEPLAPTGEANPGKFAGLSDRVSLKLSGKQRYGTQLRCVNTAREPMPLEDPAGVDALRAAVGMRPLADSVAAANAQGPC